MTLRTSRSKAPVAVLAASLAGVGSPADSRAAPAGVLAVEGTAFVLRLGDGRVLRGEQLAGAALVLRIGGRETRIHVESAMREQATGGEVVLYRFTAHDPVSGAVSELCAADAKGRSLGFPLPDGKGGFTLTCTSGAEGKCVLLGYRPWEADPSRPMKALHRACVHLLRADYGGDDRPTTRNGTQVDISDRFGIQVSDAAAGMTFEAAWGPDGAVCVAHPRIAENVSLRDLRDRYPRLAGRLGPEACSEQAMRADPAALIFNRSFPAASDRAAP